MSIAAVALDHRLNANLLRRWVVAQERAEQSGAPEPRNMAQVGSMPAHAAFVPVAVQGPVVTMSQEIVIELRRGSIVVKVSWPLAAASACGAWLGELLR